MGQVNTATRNRNTDDARKEKRQQKQLIIPKCEIKYSAHTLYKKGIVLEIEGLPLTQFKNVFFKISTTEDEDVLSVSVKFMDVTMGNDELIYQDLLKLHSDGVKVMTILGKAKINVNLLTSLLIKKFYGK